MESPATSGAGKKGLRYFVFRCWFTFLLSVIFSFFFSFACGIFAVMIGNFSVSNPISVASNCKIVSSDVDLRSSKVCELGVFNYKAKHVFYPLERTRFRCHHDYYWASIFKVEYKEYSSGQTLHALAEAPKEALPRDCRPNFGAAWLTKDKFKVNETYSCTYTPGFSKVDIFSDSDFNCQAKDPSIVEMIRRFSILFTRSISSIFSNKRRVVQMFREALVGMIVGVVVSIIFIGLVKFLQVAKLRLARKWGAGKLRFAVYAARFRQACILVAYFSAVGWLILQYGKMLGLSRFFHQL